MPYLPDYTQASAHFFGTKASLRFERIILRCLNGVPWKASCGLLSGAERGLWSMRSFQDYGEITDAIFNFWSNNYERAHNLDCSV